jgi:hypothetical protein
VAILKNARHASFGWGNFQEGTLRTHGILSLTINIPGFRLSGLPILHHPLPQLDRKQNRPSLPVTSQSSGAVKKQIGYSFSIPNKARQHGW